MPSFLLKINKMGSIEQVIWSSPDDAVSRSTHTVFQLFAADGKIALLNAIRRSSQREDALLCDTPVKLKDQPFSLFVYIVSMGKWFLVFACDNQYGGGFHEIILMFLGMVKNCVNNTESFTRTSPGAEQVEMIQTLMGELRDRKRMLEDANTQLNTMNQDLNNRLVKDSLTGLVSRYQYRTEMEYQISRNPGKLGIFVFIDIDDFKSVNDKHGHAIGDLYLVEFAERLKRLPIKDIVCMRISGDEFGLFLYDLEECNAHTLDGVWRQLKHHVLSGPIVANGRSLPLAISAGMAVYGVDTTEIYDLIECADQAMYTAKRRGKNRHSIYSKQ